MLDINFINEFDATYDQYERLFTSISECTVNHLKLNDDFELSITLINDEKMRQLNSQYRTIDSTTDVLSFANEDDNQFVFVDCPRLLGDIFISVDRAEHQALEYGHSLKREISFLFIHGLLHLLGYDHQEVEGELTMNKLQTEILNKLAITR